MRRTAAAAAEDAEDAEAVWLAAQREACRSSEGEDEDEELLRGVPCANDAVPAAGDIAVQRQQRRPQPVALVGDTASTTNEAAATVCGLCEYPPLSLVSFMMRGDNGVVRWLTASGLPTQRASRKREREPGEEDEEKEGEEQASAARERRRRHGGLGYVDVPALLRRLYDAAAAPPPETPPALPSPPPQQQQQQQQSAAQEEALWVVRYRPKRFRELLSDDGVNLKLLQWLKSWDAYIFQDAAAKGVAAARPEERLAVLVGPPGVGKTTLAHVLAAHCGYETIEINASVDRTASRLESAIQLAVAPARGRRRAPSAFAAAAAATATVDSAAKAEGAGVSLVDLLLRPKCLIIDEMDGIAANVAAFLLQQDIHCPVFCLCNDFYVPSLRSLRRQCQHVYYLPPIRPQRLLSRLGEIAAREGLPVSQPALAELAQSSNGDVRCCLNTLQFLYRHASRAGGRGEEALQLMREMQGKDSALGLWDTWRRVFERQERGKYVHLLRKEFAMDCGPTLAADSHHGTAAEAAEPAAPGFRVDPGHVYVSRVVQQCPDPRTLLEGLQEFYLQRAYADYSLGKTQSMAEAFCFQDVLTTRSYRDAAAAALIPFAEQYACTTAATCFSCCSSSRRTGAGLGFPRESAGLSRRLAESTNIARTFRDGCRGETAVHMSSVNVVAQETAPLLLHALLDASLRVPAHSVASVAALSPRDQSLLLAAVSRHAEYGLSYARAAKGGHAGGDADVALEERWELTPPIHRLAPAAAAMVLRVREELRQLMVGEIRRFVIQRGAPRLARAGAKGTGEKTRDLQAAAAAAAKHPPTAAPPAPPAAATPAKPKLSGKRDFFGRLVSEGAAKAAATCMGPAAAAAAKLTVQYTYHDGCTNGVRIPAAFSDF
ncbi:uncharacterized protein Tco025E_01105 [Trypanosoma conorhini]|uniref:AAA+ ATPase domain-containing protein n=1 Tax=Trypanosoma conorhini TaxID=83891 RepID=A0A422Q9J5_9TRYP|nr:uncharacterized protein Tco025E_01105 [Trypanosoma conorhini]RNF26643.1 hypothetical protein Tco025E_01105 [Trypanosoma conorhini]